MVTWGYPYDLGNAHDLTPLGSETGNSPILKAILHRNRDSVDSHSSLQAVKHVIPLGSGN